MATRKDKSAALYAFRDKNYQTTSPHYKELSDLIKKGDRDLLVQFAQDKIVSEDHPAYTEFTDAVSARFGETDKKNDVTEFE